MPTTYVEAAVFMEHRGVKIYHVYKYDCMDSGVAREFTFSLDPDSRDECAEEYQNFDIRDLNAYKSNDWSPEDVLRVALDNGELDDLIKSAIQDGGCEIDVLATCGQCGNEGDDIEYIGTTCNRCNRGVIEVKLRELSTPATCAKCDAVADVECKRDGCPATEAAVILGLLPFKDSISIEWHIDDVKNVRPDLTDDQCRQVLASAKENHDATVGINWDTLNGWAQSLYGDAPDEADEDAVCEFCDAELAKDGVCYNDHPTRCPDCHSEFEEGLHPAGIVCPTCKRGIIENMKEDES